MKYIFTLTLCFLLNFYLNSMDNKEMPKEAQASVQTQEKINSVLGYIKKNKSEKFVEWAKRHKLFLATIGLSITALAAIIFARKFKEYKGKDYLNEGLDKASWTTIRHQLAFETEYKGFKILRASSNPMNMNKRELNSFLKGQNLEGKKYKIGKSQIDYGGVPFNYSFIKVEKNLFIYPMQH